MKILFILNEPPYGSEKTYNALRLAMALQKDQSGTEVRVFLMADAVTAAIPAQTTPQGYYNVERMLKSVLAKGGHVKLCGTCCEARGIKAIPLVDGVEVSTMSQLAQWTVESDRVLVF
ncbi:DsrE/DsrF/TusD sulfur relay family protein [Nitrosomonas communis]|uniref:DsrE/DsrF/TusD sulfur relay family protein n=1 Tax=Nitrosomonas communis TaxID=44574 RepID=UPI0026F04A86|nr:DsrE family protein [Nitrosomonas communis]MCO6428844.1 DsrE family protein [Nitrosomonas communis]